MEVNKREEGTDREELGSLSEMISTICSEDHNELNPLQEIFGPNSSSSTLDFSESQRDTRDHSNKSTVTGKRQRSMEYRVVMEKKRRQVIREKVDILQGMTPNCTKTDLATKLENIVEYIKSLKHQRDIMAKTYTQPAGYMAPFYGAQAPCMAPPYTTPWGYYAPGIPMMPQQNMSFKPQFHQVHFLLQFNLIIFNRL
ncbi:unnamed protein product [Thlaspi arvense]|uniref:BHLH domain-containing protein n=1 Tax=Thlaspi arvense TaxID=13288 RepID=A0AAU9SLE9_THLAR|nr:unnamed protein product [Thlaspi arvense]